MSRNPIIWTTLAVIAACIGVFVVIALQVTEKGTPAIDQLILNFMRHPIGRNDPAGPRWIEEPQPRLR